VRIGDRSDTGSDARSLVSNTLLEDFRCGATTGAVEDGAFLLTAEEAAALRVKEGDQVRVLTSHPRAK
jgi:arginine N-succinyltransferase